jgi:hypothetical protein
MNYRQKPYYITKVDDDGYYELNYLSPENIKSLLLKMKMETRSMIREKKNRISERAIDIEKSISGLNLSVYPSKKPEIF